MTILKRLFGLAFVTGVVASCQIFEDQTPEFISLRMTGAPGDSVMMIYSKQFVAGVDEVGVTRVEIFGADTVFHALPIDTIIDVRLERRIYLQGEVIASDTLNVDARVDVDGRNLFNGAGDLFPGVPWQFLYQFNTRFTDNIEVIL